MGLILVGSYGSGRIIKYELLVCMDLVRLVDIVCVCVCVCVCECVCVCIYISVFLFVRGENTFLFLIFVLKVKTLPLNKVEIRADVRVKKRRHKS